MMWVLVALVITEGVVVHLLLALWQPWIAVVLSLVSGATLVWLIRAIRSFKSLPVEISGDVLIWRAGNLKSVNISVGQIADFARQWSGDEIKRRDVLNCALIAYPNTVLVLQEPVIVGRRSISRLAHRLDDPAAFAIALGPLLRHAA